MQIVRLRSKVENVILNIDLEGGFFGLSDKAPIPHSHRYYEIHTVLSGEVDLWCESGNRIIKKDDILVIAPNVLHSLMPADERSFKSSFCFSYSKSNVKSDFDLYGYFDRAFRNIDGVLQLPPSQALTLFLNKILEIYYSEKGLDRFRIKSYFLLLLTELVELIVPSERQAGAETQNAFSEIDLRHFVAEEFIQMNYNTNITLADLARTWHLSQKQTARVFESEFGQSFKDYLTQIRLSNAKLMLKDTELPVGEIAERVGYASYNGFYAMFRANTGMTPNEYRGGQL